MAEAAVQPLRAWSFSTLQEFERCKKYYQLKRVNRLPEPPRELKVGQTEQANTRGERIHKAAEDFVTLPSPIELIDELKHYKKELVKLRALFAQGTVSCEQQWGYDLGWQPCGWMDPQVWLRVKLDFLVHHE
jgi:hypothetical protein